jgi:hypothetical protein
MNNFRMRETNEMFTMGSKNQKNNWYISENNNNWPVVPCMPIKPNPSDVEEKIWICLQVPIHSKK